MSNLRKTGMNAKCPCGLKAPSGKFLKFKRCCFLRSGRPTQAFIEGLNRLHQDDTDRQHRRFRSAHRKGKCYLCKLSYADYDSEKPPCPHWLLRPQGIDKRAVALVFTDRGCFGPQAFLRWVANTESFGTNINDLRAEGDPSKVFEVTITYQNFEWSFSCSEGDYSGHPNSHEGDMPHFHVQMRIDGQRFIDYGNFYFPFTEADLLKVRTMRGEEPDFADGERYGAGMKAIMESMEYMNEDDMSLLRSTDDDTGAQLHMGTAIIADEGKKISGDDIADMLLERKKTGVSLAHLVRRLKDVTTQTFIEPGPGVPEKASRTKIRKGSKGSA